MDISDIIPNDGRLQRIYCVNCHQHLDLAFVDFNKIISGICIRIDELPTLQCPTCGKENLPNLSRLAIVNLHEQAIKTSVPAVHVGRRKRTKDLGFTKVPFIYDPDDYFYIPGLVRPFDQGFLQTVLYMRSALRQYDNSPGYRVRFASTTYGQILTEGDVYIPLGINRFGNLVMWLGDIAKLPEAEQYYLRAENVASDHSIGSEFYDGQIEVVATEPSTENKLFRLRSEFIEACHNRFGRRIAHLEKEVYDLALNLNPPVIDTIKERRKITDTHNKIYLESFDNKALKDVLASVEGKASGSGSLKRLQAIFETLAPSR